MAQAIRDATKTITSCEAEWIGVLAQLRAEVGEDAFRNWLQPINLEHVDSGLAVIAVPTRFLRDWVATHYADRLLALWRAGTGEELHRTRALGFTCLKLLKAKRLIISAPADAVTRNASISPGRPVLVRSLASHTKAATMAAADGLGRPSK